MVTRRDFLRRSSITAISLPFLKAFENKLITGFLDDKDKHKMLGRILFDDTPTYSRPDIRSASNGKYNFNDVVMLTQPIKGNGSISGNDIWFGIEENSYIQSHNLQLVQNLLNKPQHPSQK